MFSLSYVKFLDIISVDQFKGMVNFLLLRYYKLNSAVVRWLLFIQLNKS